MSDSNSSRHILIHGFVLIFVGLIWGLVVPNTPFPRLALGAHIQFETNGMLFVLIGVILLKVQNRVGAKSIAVITLSAWLTWLMALSEVANAWWGTTQILPIAAHQAGATGAAAWQETVVKLAHILAGLSLIVSVGLMIIGVAKQPVET